MMPTSNDSDLEALESCTLFILDEVYSSPKCSSRSLNSISCEAGDRLRVATIWPHWRAAGAKEEPLRRIACRETELSLWGRRDPQGPLRMLTQVSLTGLQ